MATSTEILEGQQKLLEDLRRQARELEAREGSGDKEAVEAVLQKVSALEGRLDGLAARLAEPPRDRRWGARLARLLGLG